MDGARGLGMGGPPQTPPGTPGSGGRMQNPLFISWTNSHIPPNELRAENILEYFCNHSNTQFYDRTCNNEQLKMQRLPIDRLESMQGVQYVLLKSEAPLFVIRKQNRISPTEVTPLADYYIIGGVVYQAPHMNAVITSRLLSATISLRDSFQTALEYSKYDPSRGYHWEFGRQASTSYDKDKKDKAKKKDKVEGRVTKFQMERADMLLGLMEEQFPLPEASTNQRVPFVQVSDEAKSDAGSSVAQGAEPQTGIKRAAEKPGLGNGPPAKKPRS